MSPHVLGLVFFRLTGPREGSRETPQTRYYGHYNGAVPQHTGAFYDKIVVSIIKLYIIYRTAKYTSICLKGLCLDFVTLSERRVCRDNIVEVRTHIYWCEV